MLFTLLFTFSVVYNTFCVFILMIASWGRFTTATLFGLLFLTCDDDWQVEPLGWLTVSALINIFVCFPTIKLNAYFHVIPIHRHSGGEPDCPPTKYKGDILAVIPAGRRHLPCQAFSSANTRDCYRCVRDLWLLLEGSRKCQRLTAYPQSSPFLFLYEISSLCLN